MISPRLFRSNDFPFMAVQRERAKNFRSCVHVWRSTSPSPAREMSLCSEKRVRVISRYAGTSFFSQALTLHVILSTPPFAPSPPLANPYRISQIYLSHLFQTRVPFFRTALLSRSDYSIFRRSREEACCVWSPCDIFLLYFVLYFLGGGGYEFTRERNFRNSLPSIFSRVGWRIQGSVFFFFFSRVIFYQLKNCYWKQLSREFYSLNVYSYLYIYCSRIARDDGEKEERSFELKIYLHFSWYFIFHEGRIN